MPKSDGVHPEKLENLTKSLWSRLPSSGDHSPCIADPELDLDLNMELLLKTSHYTGTAGRQESFQVLISNLQKYFNFDTCSVLATRSQIGPKKVPILLSSPKFHFVVFLDGYESFSDVGEIRVYFASKILMPCRMH